MSEEEHAVVTGGAGFVGSHLVDSLIKDDYRVTILDNFVTGNQANLSHHETEALSCVSHDVRNELPNLGTVDVFYHLASRASPTDFEIAPVEIATTNSIGTYRVFENARKHDASVVLASTSEVYGDPEQHPQSESYTGNVDIRSPRAPYDEGKRFSESLAVAYMTKYNLDIRTARIFNTYGPRMRPDDGRVVPTFLSQAIDGEPLTVHGDGSQTRCFCYVSDLVRGLRTLADVPTSTVGSAPVNLGSTREITIQALAQLILDVVETDSEIVYEERPPSDPDIRQPDITRARELLDWDPNVELATGLKRTAKSFVERAERRGQSTCQTRGPL